MFKKIFSLAILFSAVLGTLTLSAQTCGSISVISESVSPAAPLEPCTDVVLTYSWSYSGATTGPISVQVNLPYGVTYQSFISGTNVTSSTGTSTTTAIFNLSSLNIGSSTISFNAHVPCNPGNQIVTSVAIGACPTTNLSNSLGFAASSMTVTLSSPSTPLNANTGDIIDLVFQVQNNSVGNIPNVTVNYTPDGTTSAFDCIVNTSSAPILTPPPGTITNPIVVSSTQLNALLGNPYIAQTQTIYIHVRLKVTGCNNVVNGSYVFTWGCGSPCETITVGTDINVLSGTPNLQVTNLTFPTIVNSSFCTPNNHAKYGFHYLNNGTPVATTSAPQNAKVTDLVLWVYCTDEMGSLDTNTFAINGILIPNSVSTYVGLQGSPASKVYRLDFKNYAATGTPFGPNAIQDVDGDGKLDDVKVNDFFDLTVDFIYSSTCPPEFSNCNKFLELDPLATQEKYQNQCGDLPVSNVHAIPFSITNSPSSRFEYLSASAGSTISAPTDVLEGPTNAFNLTICPKFYQQWMTQDFNFSCPGGYYQIKVPLPAGYNVSYTSPISPTGPNSGTIPIPISFNNCLTLNSTITATVTQVMVGPGLDYALINLGMLPQNYCNPWTYTHSIGCFDLPLWLTCMDTVHTPNFGYDNLSYSVEYVCDPTCSCVDKLCCASTTVFHHCNGPCASEFSTTNSFTLKRKTLGKINTSTGYTYANFFSGTDVPTTPLNGIRLDAAYPSDEVRATVSGSFSGTGTNYSSMFLQLRYDDFGASACGTPDVFAFVSGTINVTSSVPSLVPLLSYPLSSMIVTVVGSEVHMDFPFPSNPFSTTFNSNATIQFTADIVLRVKNGLPNAPLNATFFSYGDHPFVKFRSEYMGNKISVGIMHSCDHWGAPFRALQPKVDCYAYRGTYGGTVSDCSLFPVDFVFRVSPALLPINQEDFPNEFKPYAELDNPTNIIVPQGYTYVSSQFEIMQESFAAGSPTTNYFSGSVLYPITPLSPSVVPVGTQTSVTYNPTGGWPLLDLALNGNVPPTYGIRMFLQPKCNTPSPGYFSWSPNYTQQIQQPNTAYQNINLPFSIAPNDLIVTHVAASLSVTAPSTVSIVGNTATFTFNICNTSGNPATAPWIAFENPLNHLILNSVTGPGVLSTATYPAGNLFVALNPLGAGNCWTLTLNVTVGPGGCVPSGGNPLAGIINVKFGYECSAITFTNPGSAQCSMTPTQCSYNIYPSSVNLIPLSATTTPVPLCGGQLIYQFKIQNPDQGFLGTPDFWMQLPTGISFVSATFNYPYNNLSGFTTASMTPNFPVAGALGWNFNTSYPNLAPNGLPGSGSNPNNQILVTCTLQVGCGYNANSPINFYAEGKNTCNVLVSSSATDLPSISGALPADNLTMTSGMSNSNLTCNNNSVVSFTITNGGPNATQHNNLFTVVVPTSAVSVSGLTPGFTSSVSGGFTTYSWTILPGLPFSGTQTFSFTINTIGCPPGPQSINTSLGYNENVTCINNTTCPVVYNYPGSMLSFTSCCSPCTASAGNPVIICSGSSTNLTATGGVSYVWTPATGLSNATISNPVASPTVTTTYTVTVTTSLGASCTATVTVTIDPPIVVSSVTPAPVSCFGGSNGAATVNATGGLGALTYVWSPSGQTNFIATGLAAGNYTCTITDAYSCSIATTVTITQPTLLTATATATTVSCNGGNNGTATATAIGGYPPYVFYAWSPSGQTNATATGLAAGTYTCIITDANLCTVTTTVTVSQPSTAITATATSQTNISCNGGHNGSTTITASGGTPGYTYLWSPSGSTNTTISNLSAGTYVCTITDSKGCTATVSVTITQPTALTATTLQTNVLCFGGSTGIATVTVSGGTPGYLYAWNTSPVQTNATATGLSATNYTCTITDSKGCSTTKIFTIGQPTKLTLNGNPPTCTCEGTCTGTATPIVGGGTPSYTYLWTPSGQTTAIATGLCHITYTLVVTDANGCTVTRTPTIPTCPPINVSITSVKACFGVNGSATATATGGLAPYTYSWTPGGQTTQTATGLTPGNYLCTVTDAKGCHSSQTVTIKNSIIIINGNQCNIGYLLPSTTPCVTFTPIINGTGVSPYTYNWSTGATTSAISVCTSVTTTYTLTVSDANGCSTSALFVFFVLDARCGHNGTKVLICNHGNTVCIAQPAVSAYLAAHPGSYIGPCLINNPCNNQRVAYDSTIQDHAPNLDDGYFKAAPNPFNESTLLSFGFEHQERVVVKVFDLTGKLVTTIYQGEITENIQYNFEFNCNDLTSGIYFAELSAEKSGKVYHLKLIVQK